jgi:hypothetical protein
VDKKQLTMIAAVCGAATVLGTLLPWWSISVGPISTSASGIDWGGGVVVLLLGAAAAVMFGATALGKGDKVPLPDKTKTLVGMSCLAVAALLTVIKFLDMGSGGLGGVVSRGIGLWLTTAATVVGTVAGVMLFKAGGGQAASTD